MNFGENGVILYILLYKLILYKNVWLSWLEKKKTKATHFVEFNTECTSLFFKQPFSSFQR